MRPSSSPLSFLSLSKLSTINFSTVILFLLLASFLLPSNAFAQGSKRKSLYDPIEEKDKDRPDKRSEWLMRGRVAPKGQSAAALRLRAHQQKMAMRAARQAVAAKAGRSTTAATAAVGWVPLGPAPLVSDQSFYGDVSGRVTAIAVDPSDTTGNTVYAAAAYGGVWKSTNAADAVVANVTWTPVTDQQASLANGAVSVKPDGTVVLVGTGEPDNAIDSYYGVGILRSTDKGATWTLISSSDSGAHPFAGLGVNKFAWVPASNTVVAATATAFLGFDEGLIGNSTNRGLYLSTNAGQTWAYQAPTDGSTPISATDVVYNATAGKFFAAIRFHGVYSSTNGTSWTRLTNQPNPTVLSTANCPVTVNNNNPCPMYRGQFTVVPGRNEMYFWFIDPFLQDQGIWQSLDGGTSWKQLQPTSQCTLDPDTQNPPCGMLQPFYNLELSAMPNGTATDLYAGLVNLYKCRVNTGTQSCATIDSNLANSWINITKVYTCPSISGVHPDEHGLDFEIVGGKAVMYFGNDGGVYRTLDGLTKLNSGTCGTANTFDDLNATIGSMTQFVSFSTHPTDQDTVLGGTQDNGSPATTTATSSSLFFTANGGDGGYNAIDATSSLWYTANTDVSIQVCSAPLTSCNSNNFFPVVTAGTAAIGFDFGAFYSPYILDPQDPAELLLGTCRVWRGTASGSSFSTLSPNFDTGTSATCTGLEVNQIRAIAAGGPKDGSGFSNVVYAASDGVGPLGGNVGGLVGATTNAATTQMSDVTGSINPSSYSISSVAIDNSDATGKTAYVGIMGFNTSHVWKTTDAGGTGLASDWTDWTGSGLPDSPVNALLVDSQAGKIYAGTDVGIFVSSTSGASWAEVGPAPSSGQAGYLPNVPVSAIRIFNSGAVKKLRASTYGRGIWEYSLPGNQDFTVPTTLTNPPNANPGQQTSTSMPLDTLPAGGTFTGNVTYACTSGLPTGATCSFNPTQISSGGSGQSVTVTVQTAGPFTGAASGTRPRVRSQKQPLWLPLTLPLAGMVLVGLAGRRLPRRYKIVGLCLALAVTGFLVACGGGSSSPPPPISVTVSPNPVNTLYPNLTVNGVQGTPQTQLFTATVANSTQGVSWAVTGGNANGTIVASTTNPLTATYTAPATLPNPASLTATATSVADATKVGPATVNLKTPTPAGASTVVVTVTEGSVQHTTSFSLTVN
jgi:hypothetical protein